MVGIFFLYAVWIVLAALTIYIMAKAMEQEHAGHH